MTSPQRRRSPWLAALAGLATVASGCSDGTERAADIATARVRDDASGALEMVEETLTGPEARGGQELVDQVRARLTAGPDVILFDARVDDDGSVSWGVAFHARGESGGGLSYESVVARLCVELTAEPGPPPIAAMRDTRCPRRLPGSTGNAGNVDLTVSLRG